jgi:hypothetical protein
MMYILTEKEYNDLVNKRAKVELGDTKKLQKLCTKIANEMPVKWGWGGADPKPWGCFITAVEKGEEWFCDTCPVQSICPYDDKRWSQ